MVAVAGDNVQIVEHERERSHCSLFYACVSPMNAMTVPEQMFGMVTKGYLAPISGIF